MAASVAITGASTKTTRASAVEAELIGKKLDEATVAAAAQHAAERVQPAVRRYADIGVRIEDSYLVEDTGLVNLSAAVPKSIEAVESFLRVKGRDSKQP